MSPSISTFTSFTEDCTWSIVGCSLLESTAAGSEPEDPVGDVVAMPAGEPDTEPGAEPADAAGAPSNCKFWARYEFNSVRSRATSLGCPAALARSAASNFFSALAAASGLVGICGAGDVRNTKMITTIKPTKLVQVRI